MRDFLSKNKYFFVLALPVTVIFAIFYPGIYTLSVLFAAIVVGSISSILDI